MLHETAAPLLPPRILSSIPIDHVHQATHGTSRKSPCVYLPHPSPNPAQHDKPGDHRAVSSPSTSTSSKDMYAGDALRPRWARLLNFVFGAGLLPPAPPLPPPPAASAAASSPGPGGAPAVDGAVGPDVATLSSLTAATSAARLGGSRGLVRDVVVEDPPLARDLSRADGFVPGGLERDHPDEPRSRERLGLGESEAGV